MRYRQSSVHHKPCCLTTGVLGARGLISQEIIPRSNKLIKVKRPLDPPPLALFSLLDEILEPPIPESESQQSRIIILRFFKQHTHYNFPIQIIIPEYLKLQRVLLPFNLVLRLSQKLNPIKREVIPMEVDDTEIVVGFEDTVRELF